MRKNLKNAFRAIIILMVAGVGWQSAYAQCPTSTGPTNDCTDGDAFDSFTLNGVTVNNGCTSGTGYASFTSPFFNVTAGTTVNMSASVGGGNWNDGIAIWIDLNGNDTLEASEQVYASTAPSTSHSGTVTIPPTAVGDTVVMRIMTAWNTSIAAGDACTSGLGSGFGDTEDYPIIITPLPAINLAAISVDSLSNGCGLTATETICMTLVNNGANTINIGDTIPLSYSINGGAVVNENFILASSLATGDTGTYCFTTTADFSAAGTYDVQVWGALAGDGDSSNDTVSLQVISIPLVSSLPYSEDFESGDGGWIASGTNSTWEWGMPAGTNINSTYGSCGGNNAWVTNLTGDYNSNELSYVTSPCFDFSSVAVDPFIRFDHNYITESCCDEGWVEVSTDGGNIWNKVGASGTGINWYNDAGNDWWDGTSNGWRLAAYQLTGTAGQASVRVRFVFSSDGSVTDEGFAFDNINVVSGSAADISVDNVTLPAPGCGLGTDSVKVTVTNVGLDTLTNIPVCYVLDGGASVCDTVAGPLVTGQTITHVFTTLADFSSQGIHTVNVYTVLPGDMATCNDSASGSTESVLLVSNYPYFENFENGTGGWNAGGTNNSWAFGTPAKDVIQGAASGSNAWVTGGLGTGTYNVNEDSYVIGPCFDLTTPPANATVTMKVWWEAENSWDGANLQVSADSGNTWHNIGAMGDAINWYTDNTIGGNPGGSQIGWTGRNNTGNGSEKWVIVSHAIDSVIGGDTVLGNPYVKFRVAFGSDGSAQDDGFAFDDFSIGSPIMVNLGPDTTTCGGFMVNSGVPGGWYSWMPNGETTENITVTNNDTVDQVINVSVLLTDSIGQAGWDTVVVTVHPTPIQPNLGVDTILCSGDSIILMGGMMNSRYAYSWTGGTSDSALVVTTPGTYGVTIVDTASGCSVTDSIVISSGNLTAAYTSVDSGLIVNFTNTTMGVADSVVWDFGDGSTSTMMNPTHTYASDGNYTVCLTVYNICGSDSTCTMISACDMLAGSIGHTASQDTVDFTYTSTSGTGTSYMWNFGDGNTANTKDATHAYGTSGTFNVTLTIMNICGDSLVLSDSVSVTKIGLEDFINAGIKVYPNPSNGQFNLSFENSDAQLIDVTITDLVGKTIVKKQLSNTVGSFTETINMNGIADGVYILRVNVDGKLLTQKLIVE